MAAVRRNVIVVGGTCSGIHPLWIRELCFNSDFTFPGKTSLLSVFLGKEFPTDLTATVLDTYIAQVELDGRLVVLALQTLAVGRALKASAILPTLVPMSSLYATRSTHRVISTMWKRSYERPKIAAYKTDRFLFILVPPRSHDLCPGVPIVLVGCKRIFVTPGLLIRIVSGGGDGGL